MRDAPCLAQVSICPSLTSSHQGASSKPVTIFPHLDLTSNQKTLSPSFLPAQLLAPTWGPPSLAATSACPPKGGKGGPGFPRELCLSACPLSGDLAEAFREICPAGHGYTYSSSHIRLAMRKAEEEELARPSREQAQKSYGTPPGPAERQPLRAVTDTWLEPETVPDKGIWAAGGAKGFPCTPPKSPWVLILDPWLPNSGAAGEGV